MVHLPTAAFFPSFYNCNRPDGYILSTEGELAHVYWVEALSVHEAMHLYVLEVPL